MPLARESTTRLLNAYCAGFGVVANPWRIAFIVTQPSFPFCFVFRLNKTFEHLGSKSKADLMSEGKHLDLRNRSIRKDMYRDDDDSHEAKVAQRPVAGQQNWMLATMAFFFTSLIVMSLYYLVSCRLNSKSQPPLLSQQV